MAAQKPQGQQQQQAQQQPTPQQPAPPQQAQAPHQQLEQALRAHAQGQGFSLPNVNWAGVVAALEALFSALSGGGGGQAQATP